MLFSSCFSSRALACCFRLLFSVCLCLLRLLIIVISFGLSSFVFACFNYCFLGFVFFPLTVPTSPIASASEADFSFSVDRK